MQKTAAKLDFTFVYHTNMNRFKFCSCMLAFCLSSVFLVQAQATKLKKRDYAKHAEEMAVILLDVNWGRKWSCAGFENSQLLSLGFENVASETLKQDKYSEIQLKTPSRVFVDPEFLNYGFLVIPGTYAFTSWSVKVARSVQDVRKFVAVREDLVDGDTYHGGTVEVRAGEVIYIGNFFLDCFKSPIPWRYYTQGQELLQDHFGEYKTKFNFLEDKEIIFRLLETRNYGNEYVPTQK